MSAELEDKVEIPPSERQEINRMGDIIRAAQAKPKAADKASAIAPVSAPPNGTPPVESKPAAPKPPEAPAPSPKPVEEDQPPKNAKDWKAVKDIRDKAIAEAKQYQAGWDAAKAEVAALKSEMDTLKKGSVEYDRVKAEHTAAKEQLTAKDKEIKERDDILQRFALEHDPRFKAHYDGEIKLHAASVGQFAPPDAVAKFDAILAMGPSKFRNEQVNALVEELADNRMASNAIVNAYLSINTVEQKKALELSRSAENWALVKAEDQRRMQAEQQAAMEQMKALLDTAHQTAEAELTGLEADTVASFKESTRKVITDRDKGALLSVIKDAAKGKKYDRDIAASSEKITKLEAQVAALTSATPPGGGMGGGKPAIRGGDRGEPNNNDIGGVYHQEMAKRRAQAQR